MYTLIYLYNVCTKVICTPIYSYVKFVYRGTVFETLKGVSVRYFMISQTGSERFYNELLFW